MPDRTGLPDARACATIGPMLLARTLFRGCAIASLGLGLTLTLGCDPAESEEGETGGGEEAPASPCENEARAMEFSAGLEVDSDEGVFRARLVDAMPAPPSRFINEWNLEFEALGEAKLDAAELQVTPWMPDHGHGAAPLIIEPQDDGSFQVRMMDLHMIGYWEIHIDFEATDGSWSDRATYGFCVE